MHGKISSAVVNRSNYNQLINGQVFNRQFANVSRCTLVTVAHENEISQYLCKSQTTDEIMNFVNTVDSESWTPELSSLLNERLVRIHYKSLCAGYPWLHENAVYGSKQLRLGDAQVLQDATAPIHRHTAYETWMKIVQHNCSNYSPDQLASALLSTTNLFVDPESSCMHCLLSEAHQRLPDFSWAALAALSSSLKAFTGNTGVLARASMKRTQTLLPYLESVNATELVAVTTFFAQSKRFMSVDMQCQLVTRLLQILQTNKEVLLSPTCIEALIRLRYINKYDTGNEHNNHKLFDFGTEICQKYINQFTVSDVAKMCVLLQSCGRRDILSLRHVYSILESHAVRLLSDDSRLCEVIDLMNSLSRFSSQQVVLKFYNALHSQLIHTSYIDVYSLSSLARVLARMQSVNTDLLAAVQRLVAQRAGNIVHYPVLFSSVEKFLRRHYFLDKDLERQFNHELLSYVTQYIGVSTKYATSVVAAYLLPVVKDGLPTSVFTRVIGSVSGWHKNALRKHSMRITSLQGSLSSNRQMKQLNSVLYQALCRQLDLVNSFDCLHSVACSLLMHSCQQHPTVTDQLMDMYTRYSSTLSDDNKAWKIITVFAKLDYYQPSVYDDLVNYVVSTSNSGADILV